MASINFTHRLLLAAVAILASFREDGAGHYVSRARSERDSDGETVSLEWDPTTGDVQLRLEDRVSPERSFTFLVDPEDARLAFLNPSAVRSASISWAEVTPENQRPTQHEAAAALARLASGARFCRRANGRCCQPTIVDAVLPTRSARLAVSLQRRDE